MSGNYRFYTESDDGSNLYVDGVRLINNDGLHPPVKKGADMTLSTGFHFLKVTFFDELQGSLLKVTYNGTDTGMVEMPVYAWLPPVGCFCNLGYTGPHGGPCEACVAGSYKDLNGTAHCSMCSPGKYSTATGQTSESTCLACPDNSSSVQGSADTLSCTCNQGYSGPDGGPCKACVAGQFKGTTGSTPCTPCAAGTFTATEAATTCLACPTFSHSNTASDESTDCHCNLGYTGPDGGECKACVTGTYKGFNGTAECSPCSAGKYSPASGQISESACLACPSHSHSEEGSPDPSMQGQDRVSQRVSCLFLVTWRGRGRAERMQRQPIHQTIHVIEGGRRKPTMD